MRLHAVGSRGLMPDRTLLLQLPPSESDARRKTRQLDRADRFEERAAAFHTAVLSNFEKIAESEPERVRIIPADGPPDAVTARMMAALADLL